MMGEPAAALAAAFLGLIFGSLASALSYRLPRGLPVGADRSRCPACDTALSVRDLVPLLSWSINRGSCRHCGARVSWRYPAIEGAMAALFALSWVFSGGQWQAAALLALTAFGLMVIMIADLEEGIIPDAMLIFLIPVAIGWRATHGADWLDGVAGAVFGGVVSLGLRWGFRRFRGVDALGLGDVKFFGMAGFYLGITSFGFYLAASGLAGLMLGVAWRAAGKGAVFPFAPALCAILLGMLFMAEHHVG